MSQAIKFVSTMALFCAVVSAPAIGQENLKGSVCTLSDSQTQKSIKAFAPIARFLTTEPRCVNCHGAVNPYVDDIGEKDPDPDGRDAPASTVEHGGGKQPHEHNVNEVNGVPEIDFKCRECHDGMAPKRDGTPSGNWTLAPSFRSFVGKDAPTLCKQIKRSTGNAKDLMGHLKDDNGTDNNAGTAFLGNHGIKGDKPELPYLTQAEFLKYAKDWIDAMGGEFKGDEECGCVPAHYAIRLTNTFEVRSGRPNVNFKSGSKVDVPITFADDQSFTGQAPVNTQVDISGACQGQVAAADAAIKVSGNAIETAEKHAMHIELDGGSARTANATVTCPGGSFGFSMQPMMGQSSLPSFDLKGVVGEATDKRLLSYPGISSNLHLEIVKREP
jgi:hypothetical protein